jgi:hypothetical protein
MRARQRGELVACHLQKGVCFELAPRGQARQLPATRLVPGEKCRLDFMDRRPAVRSVAGPVFVLVDFLTQRGTREVSRPDIERE